jgi:hypothetical protein
MPHRSPRLIGTGRVVFGVATVALIIYFAAVGLEKADRFGSVISALLALCALGAPYLLPSPDARSATRPGPDRAEDTGNATASGGGQANTGLQTSSASDAAQVVGSGDAAAHGPGSVANTGILRQPRRQP